LDAKITPPGFFKGKRRQQIKGTIHTMTDRLKIGEISYANCAPIYSTLKENSDCRCYEFVTGEPATLNRMLAEGSIDVSASSSIEYARHWDEYLIMPGLSISSDGPVGSILLFSKRPMEALGGQRVAVSAASATSTVLLKALLKKYYGVEAEYIPSPPSLKEMLDEAEAAMIIGDEALKERTALGAGSGLVVHDLGELWKARTGLPFVYALWMIREDSLTRNPELSRRLVKDLLAARDKSLLSYPEIAARSRDASWMGEDGLVAYWRAISYELTDRQVEGMKLFFEMAREVGELGATPALRFV